MVRLKESTETANPLFVVFSTYPIAICYLSFTFRTDFYSLFDIAACGFFLRLFFHKGEPIIPKLIWVSN